jgi:hypothetical protein
MYLGLKYDISTLDSILEIINHILGRQKSSFLEEKHGLRSKLQRI